MHCQHTEPFKVYLCSGVVVCLGLQIHLLDEEVLEAAVTVQRLQQRRSNLKGLHHTLQVGPVRRSFAVGPSLLCCHTLIISSASHAT